MTAQDTATNTAAAPTVKKPAIVVFGRFKGSRVDQAAWFAEEHAGSAKAAALNHGLTWLTVFSNEERDAATAVPEGIINDERFSLFPVRAQVMVDLQRLRDEAAKTRGAEPVAQSADGERTSTPAPATPTNPTVPTDSWAGLGVGSVVLAAAFGEADVYEGWWEAVIVGTEGEGFALRWQGATDDPTFTRQRHHIAIMHADVDKDA